MTCVRTRREVNPFIFRHERTVFHEDTINDNAAVRRSDFENSQPTNKPIGPQIYKKTRVLSSERDREDFDRRELMDAPCSI
jgi:hypothetical protein